jgi:hypothetical protein
VLPFASRPRNSWSIRAALKSDGSACGLRGVRWDS